MNFNLNRSTLESLLENTSSLDLFNIKDVTDEVAHVLNENKLPEKYWRRFILTGSYAAMLAGVGNDYSDIDLFTYRDVELKGNYGKIEFVIKKNWKDVFSSKIPSCKYSQNLVFASLIIHLFDLDCCRFVCVRNKEKRWILYTCSSGRRFLEEGINYVDKFNARSLKVHSRIQKYKERGIKSLVELPDRINLAGDIYSYTPKQKDRESVPTLRNLMRKMTGLDMEDAKRKKDKPNIVFDNRDLFWFITHQHGIQLTRLLPWYEEYLKKRENISTKDEIRTLITNTVQNKIKTHSTLLLAVVSILENLPDEYIDLLEKEIHRVGKLGKIVSKDTHTPFNKCRYQYQDEQEIHCFFPVEHKKKVYWIQVIHHEYKIQSISFFAYEDYKNYTSRSKTYIRRDIDKFEENLNDCPLPSEAIKSAIEYFDDRICRSDEESEESEDLNESDN